MAEPCSLIRLTCEKCGCLFEVYRPSEEQVQEPICSSCERDGAREEMEDARGGLADA